MEGTVQITLSGFISSLETKGPQSTASSHGAARQTRNVRLSRNESHTQEQGGRSASDAAADLSRFPLSLQSGRCLAS